MRLPYYINEKLKAYVQMSSEDRKALLDERFFDVDPLSCPTKYLPLLANEVGVEIDGFGEADARALIKSAREALLKAGTKASLERALDGVCDVEVKEQESFAFALDLSVNNKEITPALAQRLERVALSNKNVRSVMTEMRLGYLMRHNLGVSVGGVGEASCMAEAIEGYETTMYLAHKVAAGSAGEVSITVQGGV